jgi:hypothetical protein
MGFLNTLFIQPKFKERRFFSRNKHFFQSVIGGIFGVKNIHNKLLDKRLAYPGVVDALEVVPLLPGDHEGGQVGCVDGQEDHSKQSPD